MDPRSAAHVLTRIAALLELNGEQRFKTRAYQTAARAVLGLETDDIVPLLHAGALDKVAGLGPATIAVLRELVETGESSYLESLLQATPEGLLEMQRVPGLGTTKIHAIREGLGITSLHELEQAARDGRLAALPRFGPKTADKIAKGIAFLKENGALVLYPHAGLQAARVLADVRRHPDVIEAAIAGSVRRHNEVVCDTDVVAAVRGDPSEVAASFGRAAGVRDAIGGARGAVRIRYVDGTQLDLYCVPPERYAAALWRATGNDGHVAEVTARLSTQGYALRDDVVRDGAGREVAVGDEASLYALARLAYVAPELRESRGEVDAASRDALPSLITLENIRGVLHCHSDYSDGTTTIAEMAAAARERGWEYIGISDHSESAFYAGGLAPDAVRRQHVEIDAVNAELRASGTTFRVLKGIEADIRPEGGIDYDGELLDAFDYVIASVHSRFGMNETEMTDRVLLALDDPHVTILGHPTGRLLLTREPYAIDMDAIIERAVVNGIALELNADPHRLDLDWRICAQAKARGATIEIGPDAHSPRSLDYTTIGIGIARKGWLTPADVLNTRDVDGILAFARRRRDGPPHASPSH